MKLVINKGVRASISELEKLFDQNDHLVQALANPDAKFNSAMNDGFDKQHNDRMIIAAAAKLLSHATRGRRYPNMTPEYGRPFF